MKCVLLFEHEKSHLIADAVKPDNTSYMEMRVRGKTIVAEITTRTLGSLIAAVDDYLVNVKIAKDMLEMK
jgi:tRNA threonylcarbamoyladenosine modification (KEOPS) complex  Pcc1 subunit